MAETERSNLVFVDPNKTKEYQCSICIQILENACDIGFILYLHT